MPVALKATIFPGEVLELNVTRQSAQILNRPRPAWPNQTVLERLSSSELHRRQDFFCSLMLGKYVMALVVAIAVLAFFFGQKPPRYERLEVSDTEAQGPEEAERAVPPEALTMVTCAAALAQLTLVTYITMTAAHTSSLSRSYGLPWEGYDLCFTAGLCWFLAQALALRAWLPNDRFPVVDITLSSLAFLPFLGDAFDTLKDAWIVEGTGTLRGLVGEPGACKVWKLILLCFHQSYHVQLCLS